MACNKHGSRSLDAIWKHCSFKAKESLCHELSSQETLLNNNNFGKFISQNFALSAFKRAREDWKANLNKASKKRELFSDILGEGTKDSPKKKKAKVEAKPEIKPEGKQEVKEDPEAEIDEQVPEKKAKKKKKKAKSYLDDL